MKKINSKTPKAKILVVGSSNTDMVVCSKSLPKPGETVIGGDFIMAPGGKGANQAVAAARAGGEVTFIARIGKDIFGEKAVAGFKQEGINTDYIITDKQAPSGVALILVDKKGENMITVASGANAKLSPADIAKSESAFAEAKVLLCQLEIPLATIKAAVKLAKKYQLKIILDPAPVPANGLPKTLLKEIDFITPNETEAALLTDLSVKNKIEATQAAKKIIQLGVKCCLLTMGASGVLVTNSQEQKFIPGYKVKAVDATAAGDAFAGAFAVALGEGEDMTTTLAFANAYAAISVTGLGAQPSLPTRNQAMRFLKINS